jgi:transcriptional regulator with XRE-family HTH domain
MNAGRVLREARRRAGLSQRALAARVGVHQPMIARIERGDVTPRVDTLDRLLDACGEGLLVRRKTAAAVDETQLDEWAKMSVGNRVAVAEGSAQYFYRFRPVTAAQLGERPPAQPRELAATLDRHQVEYVLIGGVAANARGAPYISYDVDICFRRDRGNVERLAAALKELHATLRGAPEGLPDVIDARFLWNGDHFTFDTDYGDLDCMMTPSGIPGGYEELNRNATTEIIQDLSVRVAGLEDLIRMKEAAGRPKDRYHLEFLRAIQEREDRP